MTDARSKRQRAIVDLLREAPVRSQDEIASRLVTLGYAVTQATVSRDLDQIGAVKVRRGGALGYSLPDQLGDRDWAAKRLERIFGEWAQSIETSGSMVVVRTPPGSAHVVGLALDQAKLPEVAGTIAGDDTLFVAVRSGIAVEPFAQRLRDLIRIA
ncbi:MAG TPA: arginine repressor [Sphingomicrobium sp.]|nr:arginine repressor [Sphingomicrobium sp.]